jgi:glyoxylase-like metal-dependent hydrolase (beta-lactamase superfamily II)
MSFDFARKLDFVSDFFDLFKLSESAYGAIAKENSGMGGNAGFIDIEDYLIIIDTTGNVEAAKDLKRAATEFAQKQPSFIVITHYHMDHLMGTSLFDKTTQIMTSDRTLNNIQTEGKQRLEELKRLDLKEMEESLHKETNKDKKLELENDIKFIKTIRSEDFSLREPNITFTEGCIIYGKGESVHLRVFNKAHTNGDVIVYIPQEKVLFSGDLLFARTDPWLGSGNPEGWISVNEEIMTMDFKVCVPGHGQLASKEDFSLENKYIKELVNLVKDKIEKGEDPTQIKKDDFSKEIQLWKSPVLEWNINFLVDFLKKYKFNSL